MAGSNASRILEFVNTHPGAILNEIQTATGLSPGAISNMLIRSIEHGHLKRDTTIHHGRTVWRYWPKSVKQ
jgi:DNA-binding IclR family transcriptional regulator